jgi:DeoR/GlpR family transcriptional regulator of sugar metabolism
MLVAERQKKIIELVNERGSVRVTELSRIFAVTEETIRRDLDALERQKKLRRSHGGAVKMKDTEIPYFEREIINVEAKKEIAKLSLKWIKPGDVLILDASTTAWYMAKIMPNIPLTILTNSIKVALELSRKDQIEVISTGGKLSTQSLSYVGPLAEQSLHQYHVNKVFLSCKGIHLQRGISESNELQALVKRKMIEIADEVNLMVDFSKFGVQAFAHLGDLTQLDRVITDRKTRSHIIEPFRSTGLEVVQVKEGED